MTRRCMAVKNISITEESYKRLTAVRVINKVVKKRNIMNFFGVLSKESADRLEKNIKKAREFQTENESCR